MRAAKLMLGLLLVGAPWRVQAAEPLVREPVAAIHVTGTRVLKGGQVEVGLRIFGAVGYDRDQPVTEKKVTLRANQETLVGAGSRPGDQVLVKVDRLGRATTRYFLKGHDRPLMISPSAPFGAEITSAEPDGANVRISGKLWSPIAGSDLGLKARDLRGYTRGQRGLTKTLPDGSQRGLRDVWKSIDGQGVRAGGASFALLVPVGKARTLNLGRYHRQQVKLHVLGGNIQGMSLVEKRRR